MKSPLSNFSLNFFCLLAALHCSFCYSHLTLGLSGVIWRNVATAMVTATKEPGPLCQTSNILTSALKNVIPVTRTLTVFWLKEEEPLFARYDIVQSTQNFVIPPNLVVNKYWPLRDTQTLLITSITHTLFYSIYFLYGAVLATVVVVVFLNLPLSPCSQIFSFVSPSIAHPPIRFHLQSDCSYIAILLFIGYFKLVPL